MLVNYQAGRLSSYLSWVQCHSMGKGWLGRGINPCPTAMPSLLTCCFINKVVPQIHPTLVLFPLYSQATNMWLSGQCILLFAPMSRSNLKNMTSLAIKCYANLKAAQRNTDQISLVCLHFLTYIEWTGNLVFLVCFHNCKKICYILVFLQSYVQVAFWSTQYSGHLLASCPHLSAVHSFLHDFDKTGAVSSFVHQGLRVTQQCG